MASRMPEETTAPAGSDPRSPAETQAGYAGETAPRRGGPVGGSGEPRPGAAPGSSAKRRAANVLFLAVGVLLLGALVHYVGVDEVVTLLASLEWGGVLVFVPYAVLASVDVLGWQRVLTPPARRMISFTRLYAIRLAGEAVNILTPTAGLAGEPLKAYLLRQGGIETGAGVASVVIAKGALIIAQILFTLLGVALLLDVMDIFRDSALALVGAAVVGVGVAVLIVVGQRVGVVTWTVRQLRRLGMRGSFVTRLERRAADIDAALVAFYRDDPRGFATATVLHFLAWVLGAAEVMLFFFLMGVPCDWREAFIIESLTQATMVSAAFIPGGLGVQELSGAMLCRFLGIGEAAGLAMMLLKRVREIGFAALGLALVPMLTRRAAP